MMATRNLACKGPQHQLLKSGKSKGKQGEAKASIYRVSYRPSGMASGNKHRAGSSPYLRDTGLLVTKDTALMYLFGKGNLTVLDPLDTVLITFGHHSPDMIA